MWLQFTATSETGENCVVNETGEKRAVKVKNEVSENGYQLHFQV